MKQIFTLLSIIMLIAAFSTSQAQTFDGEWECQYATADESDNGTGYPTIDVAVVSEDEFVALVNRPSQNSFYMVGYRNADSLNGRIHYAPYGGDGADFHMQWWQGFTAIDLFDPNSAEATSDGKIYVANNDTSDPGAGNPGRNILVFQLDTDTITSTEYRLPTGLDYLWAIDIDGTGRVFVTDGGDSASAGSVVVYDNLTNEAAWTNHTAQPTPLQTITVPDAGELRGIAVNSDGTMIWVSNYDARKVYRYTGDPATGYTLDPGFNYELTDTLYASVLGTDTLVPGPWGLGLQPNTNILYVACDVNFMLGAGYEYGRMYLVEPNTGAELDVIDVAEWNFLHCDSSYYRPSGSEPGNASGYTATYNVDFDGNDNIYSISYWGWTVEKWAYTSTLPVITLTGIDRTDNLIPSEFNLGQNYPNPFNPATTIEFSLPARGNVVLEVYSMTGEKIAELLNTELESGNYQVDFDASELASGTYIYTLKTGEFTQSKKMMLLK